MGIIGFTGQFKENPMVLSQPCQILVFDRALSNCHNIYDTTTGIFTPPRSGIYSFYLRFEFEYEFLV
jgi:hypothetical protein